jgi:hypothetical protein
MGNDDDPTDHRGLSRIRATYFLRIFDNQTSEELGHMADISTGGLLVIGEKKIAVDRTFSLWFEAPAADAARERVSVEAKSLWSKPDPSPGLYATGFEVIEPTAYARAKIGDLIDEFLR